MPVIVFASSKGGAGKTTACVILASELARQGKDKNIKISVIDADPEQNLAAWADLDGKPDNILLYKNVGESTILDVIEDAKNKSGIVLVDLEGVASNTVTFALSQADLVIIPSQASQMDANKAVKIIKMIKNSSRMIQRDIPFAVLFNRMSAAIVTKTAKYLSNEFETAGIDVFSTCLIEREIYKSVFSFGGTIYSVDTKTKKEQESINKAMANAVEFSEEVKVRLQKQLQSTQAVKEAVDG